MRAPGLALLLLAPLALAGCGGTTPEPPAYTESFAPFDGEAALEFVKGLALQPDGSPRFRMPGTPGQAEGAAYLWSQMDVPGWSRHWQNLTGEDYLRLDLRPVAGFGPGSAACRAEDRARLPSWPFHNLVAVHGSPDAGAPLLLLGAHWDSQMESNYDPDPARRKEPDPGANDGASGVGLLLELMRTAQEARLPFGLGVILLDGEDGFFNCYPLAGSLYFAQNPTVRAGRFLLLDMVGDAEARFVREAHSVQSDPALVDLLWRHGRARGGGAHFTNASSPIVDDHVAFIHAGVPAVDLIDAGWPGTGFPPQWDTTMDTVEKVSPRTLALVGDALLSSLADPEMAARWPDRAGAAAPAATARAGS